MMRSTAIIQLSVTILILANYYATIALPSITFFSLLTGCSGRRDFAFDYDTLHLSDEGPPASRRECALYRAAILAEQHNARRRQSAPKRSALILR